MNWQSKIEGAKYHKAGMTHVIIGLLLTFVTGNMSCSPPVRYETLPVEIYESSVLPIDKIIPDRDYNYWEYRFSDLGTDEVVYNWGNKQSVSDFNKSNSGFFVECMPLLCFSYIVAERDHNTFLIDTADKFKEFIGNVDNIEEVVILIKLNGYWFDPNDNRTGTYRKTETGYELFILDYESCPVTYKSVKAFLKYNGDFEVKKSEIIREETDCYIS